MSKIIFEMGFSIDPNIIFPFSQSNCISPSVLDELPIKQFFTEAEISFLPVKISFGADIE